MAFHHRAAYAFAAERSERAERLEKNRMIYLRRRNLRDSQNPFEMEERDFRNLFRASREMAHYMCQQLTPALEGRRKYIPVHTKVLVILRFLAEGGLQRGVGNDVHLAVGQTTVSKIIRTGIPVIIRKFGHVIRFPKTEAERDIASRSFQDMAGFPGVLGVLDCTHIAIETPKEREEDHMNNKGFHSLNVQMICSRDMKIINVNGKFPGQVHDQFIWECSAIREEMMRLHTHAHNQNANHLAAHEPHYFLIGDGSYIAEPFLLTPVDNAVEWTAESRYTYTHCTVRHLIERTFGLLKGRWKAIHKGRVLMYEPETAANIISACAILHNLSQQFGLPEPTEEEQREAHETEPPIPCDYSETIPDTRMRQEVVRRYFH